MREKNAVVAPVHCTSKVQILQAEYPKLRDRYDRKHICMTYIYIYIYMFQRGAFL